MPSTAFHNYKPPARRPLLVYAFDPMLGRKLNNYMTVAVPYEPLRSGPVGSRSPSLITTRATGLITNLSTSIIRLWSWQAA